MREAVVSGYGGVLWGLDGCGEGLCEGELTGKDWVGFGKTGRELCGSVA